MENKNVTLNIDDGVMLRLSTYNELYNKARMLDSIVEDTLATISFEQNDSSYSSLRVSPDGRLMLPDYVMDQVFDGFAKRLAHQKADYVRSLVEANVHRIDFSDFRFESYKHSENPLEYDLLKNTEFRRRWDEEKKQLEAEKRQMEQQMETADYANKEDE
jgi:hypothetical protein